MPENIAIWTEEDYASSLPPLNQYKVTKVRITEEGMLVEYSHLWTHEEMESVLKKSISGFKSLSLEDGKLLVHVDVKQQIRDRRKNSKKHKPGDPMFG